MGWGTRLMVSVALWLVAGVAIAEPAVNAGFVPVAPTRGATEDSVVVAPGDHLWKISKDRLDDVLGREASTGEVDPYWRQVIAVNRDRLRSGDPDLIYPGESIMLPAPD